MVEYRLLGPLEVLADGAPVHVGGPKLRGLLALLLAYAPETISAPRLIDELWPEQPPTTASNTLQGFISDLRKVLGRDAIQTRGSGYALVLSEGDLDLRRFEELAVSGSQLFVDHQPRAAARVLRDALALWRGPALADLADEPAVQALAARLDERRLTVLAGRLDADLACGLHDQIVAELRGLVEQHPVREGLRGQLMLALYRCGRQSEALQTYRAGRRVLVDTLGIEPSRPLQELERAILRQDPELDAPGSTPVSKITTEQTALLVLVVELEELEPLLALAEPLARGGGDRLVLTRLLQPGAPLASETERLGEHRARLISAGIETRVAAHTSTEPGTDAALLAAEQDVRLALVDVPISALTGSQDDAQLRAFLDAMPCDLALMVAGRPCALGSGDVIAVPFGGGSNEWPAIELAAQLARGAGARLCLVGRDEDGGSGNRDASRLLARASLVIQETVGILAEPRLAEPGADGVLASVTDVNLLVVGLSDRWRIEGVGAARSALIGGSSRPIVLVRAAPGDPGGRRRPTFTRHAWSLIGHSRMEPGAVKQPR